MLEDRYRTNPSSTQRAEKEVKRIKELIENAGGILQYLSGPVKHRPADKQKKENDSDE